MKLPLTSEMDFAPHDINNSMTVENFLSNLVKQGMLDYVQMGAGGRPQATQSELSSLLLHIFVYICTKNGKA